MTGDKWRINSCVFKTTAYDVSNAAAAAIGWYARLDAKRQNNL